MVRKKYLFISLAIAFSYLLLSNILLFSHIFDIPSEFSFVLSIDYILTLPASLMFVAGYAAGDGAFYLTGLVILIILSLCILPFVYIISKQIESK